jgi:predicted sugar kinase
MVFLTYFRENLILESNMQSKAAQIVALLRGKTVFYVNIETPEGQDSITETTLESPDGIAVSIEGDTVTFTVKDKTTSFVMLETTQILTNRTEKAEVIVTLAQNGGLQIKSYLK